MRLKLLKDLPGFPEKTVFESDKSGWKWSYKLDSGPVGSDWLHTLLNNQIPIVDNDYEEFFEYLQDEGDLYYVAGVDGHVTTYNSYSFWDVPNLINAFKDKNIAEEKAKQLRDVLLSDQG